MLKKMICVFLIIFVFSTLYVSADEKINLPKTQEFIINKSIFDERLIFVNIQEPLPDVPLYNQKDYPHTSYGGGTVSTHGCGITCAAMVVSYFLEDSYLPDEMAIRFAGHGHKGGSAYTLFKAVADDFGLPFQEKTTNWEVVYAALKNNQLVVSVQSKGLFTGGGHYILLTGINKDDKIFVNDPYGGNYKEDKLQDGFVNGFTIEQIRASEGTYWIYGKKELKIENAFELLGLI